MEKLFAEAKQPDVRGMMKTMRRLVPEFKPVHHFKATPPPVFKRMRPVIFRSTKSGMTSASPP